MDHGIADIKDDGVVEWLHNLLDLPLLRPHVAQKVSRDVAALGDGDILRKRCTLCMSFEGGSQVGKVTLKGRSKFDLEGRL